MTCKKPYLLALILPAVLLVFACYYSKPEEKSIQTEVSDPERIRIGFSQVETDNPWRTAQINSFKEAILPDSMEFIYHEPDEYTTRWQIDDIHSLIAEGIDYLVIVPREIKPLIPVLEEAKASGIPVIFIEQTAVEVDHKYYVSLISTDYLKEGQICAQMLYEKYGDKQCNIVEIYGTENSPVAQTRSEGFHKELEKYPNMRVVDREYGNFDRITAQKAMENALIKAANNNQVIHAVFAHSDEDGLGALQATKVAGMEPGEISIVSINGIQDVCKAVIAGEYLGTVESNPKWGQIAVFLINQMERDAVPFPVVTIPYRIINKDNANEYFPTAY